MANSKYMLQHSHIDILKNIAIYICYKQMWLESAKLQEQAL